MARKDVFKGTLEALINPPARSAPKSILHSAALDAVESGLARGLQLTELDPGQVIQSEFEDRLPQDEAALAELVDSIRAHGQQIPILVQRAENGQFRIIYGRRRLAAARTLGIRVKALVTQMDDDQRIIAQGVENTVRQDLSFIEKAMFAHRLRLAEVEEATIRAALNIDVGAPKATTISSMRMVVETLGEEVILAIGRAPGIGRPRWRALADLWRARALDADERAAFLDALAAGFADANLAEGQDASDRRFGRAMALLVPRAERMAGEDPADEGPAIGSIKATRTIFEVTVRAKDNPAFHAWLVSQGEKLLHDWHVQWQTETQQPKEAR